MEHQGNLKHRRSNFKGYGFWMECACGRKSTESFPLLGTRKVAVKWYYNHQQEAK